MANDGIEIPINVTGEDQAQRDLNATAAAVDNLGKKAQTASAPLKQAGDAADKKARAIAQLSTVTGSLSPIIGRVSGEAAKMTQVFSTAGSTITGMTSIIGGPFGIAIGAAVAATGLLVTAMSEAEAAAERESQAVDKATKSIDEYVAAAAKKRADEELQRRLATGTASRDEATGASNQAQDQRNALLAKRAQIEEHLARIEAANDPKLATRLQFARQQAQATNDQIAALDAQIAAYQRNAVQAAQVEGEKQEFERQANERHSNEAQRHATRMREAREWTAAQQGMFEAAMAEGTGGRGPELDLRSTADLMAQSSASDVDEYLGELVSAEQSRAEAAEDNAARYQQAWVDAFSTVAAVGAESLSALVQGDTERALSAIAGIGDTLVAQGTSHVLQGTAEAFLGNPGGVAAAKVGAVEIATGLAFGAAMGAAGAGDAGAVAGGSGSAAQSAAPRDTYSSGGGGAESGEQITVVLNQVVPDAYAGERVVDALDKTRRHRGKAFRGVVRS